MNKGAALKYLHGTGKFIKVFALLTRDDGEREGREEMHTQISLLVMIDVITIREWHRQKTCIFQFWEEIHK